MAIFSKETEKLIQDHIDEIDDNIFDPLFRDAINQGKYIEVRDTLIEAKVLCPIAHKDTIEKYNKIYLERLEIAKLTVR